MVKSGLGRALGLWLARKNSPTQLGEHMGDMIVKAFLAYIEKHPEVVERLIEEGVKSLITSIQKHRDKD